LYIVQKSIGVFLDQVKRNFAHFSN